MPSLIYGAPDRVGRPLPRDPGGIIDPFLYAGERRPPRRDGVGVLDADKVAGAGDRGPRPRRARPRRAARRGPGGACDRAEIACARAASSGSAAAVAPVRRSSPTTCAARSTCRDRTSHARRGVDADSSTIRRARRPPTRQGGARQRCARSSPPRAAARGRRGDAGRLRGAWLRARRRAVSRRRAAAIGARACRRRRPRRRSASRRAGSSSTSGRATARAAGRT